jgi:hypothetical protein
MCRHKGQYIPISARRRESQQWHGRPALHGSIEHFQQSFLCRIVRMSGLLVPPIMFGPAGVEVTEKLFSLATTPHRQISATAWATVAAPLGTIFGLIRP